MPIALSPYYCCRTFPRIWPIFIELEPGEHNNGALRFSLLLLLMLRQQLHDVLSDEVKTIVHSKRTRVSATTEVSTCCARAIGEATHTVEEPSEAAD